MRRVQYYCDSAMTLPPAPVTVHSYSFMLKMMKGPIEKSVHEQLDRVLKDAKPTAKEKVSVQKAAPAAKARL